MTATPPPVPAERVQALGGRDVAADRDYVLYWMVAQRRATWNFGLQRAAELARELDVPLLVLEALRHDYRWASPRLHRFVLDGMHDDAAAFEAAGVRYHAYVEPEPGAGKGLLEALASRACAVVTDWFPCFFLPRMVRAAAKKIDVRLEQVDGNGLFPLALTPKDFTTAHSFRRFLQKELAPHLERGPAADPLAGLDTSRRAVIARDVLDRWPAAKAALLEPGADLSHLGLANDVPPAPLRGGASSARSALDRFMSERFLRYGEHRNEVEDEAASGLSPFLHFGHVSVHEVVERVMTHEDWSPDDLSSRTDGSRSGWRGMSGTAESFLDELVTWRELGYVFGHHRLRDMDRYESLPEWARTTLEEHAGDRREHVYTLAEFDEARTHDRLWNAAQNQLRSEGRMHNYLRMLWGKKVLEWTKSPKDALKVLIELNNRYALDGRNPNSYSGIFWCLGRFDRAWGPEREVYGKIRYMSSDNTARKLDVKGYVERYAPEGQASLFGRE
ncbi:MAG: deoxyribodipyrimidine photolyase [Planctomycetota bacterium]